MNVREHVLLRVDSMIRGTAVMLGIFAVMLGLDVFFLGKLLKPPWNN
jgi:hypothetical protein